MDNRTIDVDKLIQEVQIRPAIWDMTHSDYPDRTKRKQVWEDIIDVFVEETTPEEERRQTGELLQKKWKNIRDRYSRELQERRGKSGNSSKKKSPYMHAQALMFLEDTVKYRKILTSISMDDSLCLSQSMDNTEVESQQEVKSRTEDDHQSVPLQRSQPIRKKRKVIPVEPKVIPALENNIVQKEKIDKHEEEYDRHFLLSLLPLMKFIPSHSKLNTRIEIMQAIKKYTVVSSPIPPLQQRHHLYEPHPAYLIQPQMHWQQQQPHHQQQDPLLVHQPTELAILNQKQPDVSGIGKSFGSPDESVKYFKDSKESSVASYITDYDSKEDSDSNLLD